MTKTPSYVLGRAREHSLRYKLIREGWFCIRCQGSAGGMPSAHIKPVDLIAVRKGAVSFIQVSKRLNDISDEERKELRRLGRKYGARPVIAYKIGNGWVMKSIR